MRVDSKPLNTFSLSIKGGELHLSFHRKTDAEAFAKLTFYSQILHSLKPNNESIWIRGKRPKINAHIKGWPKWADWERSEKKFITKFEASIDRKSFAQELEQAVTGMLGAKESKISLQKPLYKFQVVDGGDVWDFEFTGRGREIAALCVLWDKEPHSRNTVELTTKEKRLWEIEERTYGDPSKIIDELRNQGFPRQSDLQEGKSTRASIEVTRKHVGASPMEHYRLLQRDQNLDYRISRSAPTKKIKAALYTSKDFTCGVCGNRFEESHLAPDHRIPSIVQSDNLTTENYAQVLQVLCRTCNQVKREICKQCPYEKQCDICPWAFPEKNAISPENLKNLRDAASEKAVTPNDLLRSLLNRPT